MIDPAYCRLMAHYNRWCNAALYDACAGLTDEERRRDRGGYYRSVHGLLNHLLIADRVWHGRFTGSPLPPTELRAEVAADFADLRRERAATDAALCAWADAVSPEWLAAPLVWTSNADGARHQDRGDVLAVHLFNHQTLHRAQVALLLAQAGVEPPPADLPWMPGAESVLAGAP